MKTLNMAVAVSAIAIAVFAGLDYFTKRSASGGGSSSGGSGSSIPDLSFGLFGGGNKGIAAPVSAGLIPTGGGTVAGATTGRDPNCALTMFFGKAWASKYNC